MGDWAQSPIPNPQIPNPQSPHPQNNKNNNKIKKIISLPNLINKKLK
jgi:hypothetical protein